MSNGNGTIVQPKEPPKKALWRKLHSANLYRKDFDQFEQQFSDYETVNSLWGTLNKANYYKKPFEDFTQQFFADVKKKDLVGGIGPQPYWPPSEKEKLQGLENIPLQAAAGEPAQQAEPEIPDLQRQIDEIIAHEPEQAAQSAERAKQRLADSMERGLPRPSFEPSLQQGQPTGLRDVISQYARIKPAQKETKLPLLKPEAGLVASDVTTRPIPFKATERDEADLAVAAYTADLKDSVEKFKKEFDDVFDSGPGRLLTGVNEFDKSFIQFMAQLPATAGIAKQWADRMSQALDKAVGYKGGMSQFPVESIENYAEYRLARSVHDWAESMFPTNPKYKGEFLTDVLPGMAGSLMALAMGSRGTSGGTSVGMAARQMEQSFAKAAVKDFVKGIEPLPILMAGSMMGVPEFEAAKKAGLNDQDAFQVFLANFAAGSTYALPVGAMISRLNRLSGGGVLDLLREGGGQVAKDIAKEGMYHGTALMVQSVTARFLSNVTAQQTYDKFRSLYEGMAEDGASGFVLGAILGAGSRAAVRIPILRERNKIMDFIRSEREKAVKDWGEEVIDVPFREVKPAELEAGATPEVRRTAEKVAKGETIGPEELQTQKNEPAAVESELAKIKKEGETPKFRGGDYFHGKGMSFKVIGRNSEGDLVGEDKNGVRAVTDGRIIRTQPVGVVPGRGITVDPPDGDFLTTDELKQQENAIQQKTTQVGPHGERKGGAGAGESEGVGPGGEGQEVATPEPQKPGEAVLSQSKPQAKGLTGDEAMVRGERPGPEQFVDRVQQSLQISSEQIRKGELELIAENYGITDKNVAKELTEVAIVRRARELASTDDWAGIKELYERQPNLTHRTNISIGKQQYSTPAPIAYTMGKYVGADRPGVKVFEPSAGNGMLTIVGKPDQYRVNEIDPTRLSNLKGQGFGEVTSQDASVDFGQNKVYDAVITNPPFGGTRAIEIDGYKFNELAQIMAARALATMKDQGRAAVIIGGNNKFDEGGRFTGRDRIFFNWLYYHYNVDDVIDVNGDLYRKQGASFPIRVILVNGRKVTPEGIAPTEEVFGETAEDFDQLNERIQKFTHEAIQPTELGPQPAETPAVRGAGQPPGTTQPRRTTEPTGTQVSRPGAEVSKPRRTAGATGGPVEPLESAGAGGGGEAAAGQRPVRQGAPEQGRAEPEPGAIQPGGTEKVVEQKQPGGTRKTAEGGLAGRTGLTQYKPLSGQASFDISIPASMEQEVLDAQTQLSNDIGQDVDEFVRERLGYKTKEELSKALSAEQIDAVAFSIRNIERGLGTIVGDQAGIGKGRIAAAIVKYGAQQGRTPIFLTEKAGLFSAFYRDLIAIGHGQVKPFSVNTYESGRYKAIKDPDGKTIFKPVERTNAEYRNAVTTGNLPEGTGLVLATYSQFSNPKVTDKTTFLEAIARDNIIILDESHNASGSGNTNAVFNRILSSARGVVFLSATFAKRPDNMPVYANKTSMSEASLTPDQLVSAVKQGGVALQEITSGILAEAGEMLRRERSLEGVEVRTHILGGDDVKMHADQTAKADRVTDIIRDIIAFQRDFVTGHVKALHDTAVKEGDQVRIREGTNMAGVDNFPYFSKVFNVVNQLLYSIKAAETARMAIEEIEAGRKPFIAIKSTMESMLTDLMERGTLEMGDVVDPDFRFVLRKGLEGVMRIRTTDAGGHSKPGIIKPEELGTAGRAVYLNLLGKINSLETGLTISPIDEITKILSDAGYKVGEITGRHSRVTFVKGKAVLEPRKKEPTNDLYAKYNAGQLDVVIVNSSGSTGESAHSSRDFKDQRPRSMLVLEPELNISTLVQLLYRINRTGQVVPPRYTFVSSVIPAEQRLMMMTMRKLKSLDANTTSNQKQSRSLLEVPEIFNHHGDRVVIEYLQEHPEVTRNIQDPLRMLESEGMEPAKPENAAMRVTGRVAILPAKQQDEFYHEISERYAQQLQFLNEAGMNDLEVEAMPLQAKTLDRQTVIMGKGGRSKFGGDTYLERAEINVLRKPMTKSEIDKSMADLGKFSNDELQNLLEAYQEKVVTDIDKEISEKHERQIAKIRESQDLSDTEKAERISEIEGNTDIEKSARLSREQNKIRYVGTLFKFFTPGRAVKMPLDFGSLSLGGFSDAIFMGFDINMTKAKPFLPSSVILKFATNDSRRLLSIPASKTAIFESVRFNSYQLSDAHLQQTLEGWDQLKKPTGRTKRYIVTGNILQAMGTERYRGQIIRYSTQDGFINTGILLREGFDPKESGAKDTIAAPASRVSDLMLSAPTNSVFRSSDGIWSVSKRSGVRYELRVPKSKERGGKYFMDPDINDLVDGGRWDSSGKDMVAFTDSSRLPALMRLLSDRHGTSFEVSSSHTSDLEAEAVRMGERQAGTFERPNVAYASLVPVPSKKVKKAKSDEKLLSFAGKKLKEQEREAALDEMLKFDDESVEARFRSAGETPANKPLKFRERWNRLSKLFMSHFPHLDERMWPREASILREFETSKPYAQTIARTYVQGLMEPLTYREGKALARRIVLSDLVESIERGENMQDVNGLFPFGFKTEEGIRAALKKFEEISEADPAIETAFEARQAFMKTLESDLIRMDLISPTEKGVYYHRRVLQYQNDEMMRSFIYGKNIGKISKKAWMMKRVGTGGKDYSTNFIDTEFKVVAEAVYELEKRRRFMDLVAPHEAKLHAMKAEFASQFAEQIEQIEQRYGKDSEELEAKKASRNVMLKNYLAENMPEGYVFWTPSDSNPLFWVKSASDALLGRAMEAAKLADSTGMSGAIDVLDNLIGEMGRSLAVGARRTYMIPEQLALELDRFATPRQLPSPATEFGNGVARIIKQVYLLAPNRVLRYNINNAGSDIDRLLQVDPRILADRAQAWDELWDFMHYGRTTPTLLKAIRHSVIDSGHSASEFTSISKERWAQYFMDQQHGPQLEDVFGKKWAQEVGQTIATRPRGWYNQYMEYVGKYTRLRENFLRYSAYLNVNRRIDAGEKIAWATSASTLEGLRHDPELLKARLAREAFGDYGNLSVMGTAIRRTNLMPFFSWAEINFGTHIRLIRNASNPRLQREILASAARRGINSVAVRMAWAWASLFLGTAMWYAWNNWIYPNLPWVSDEQEKEAARKLRQQNIKQMPILLYPGPNGPIGIPTAGSMYDFIDWFGLMDGADDVAMILSGHDPMKHARSFVDNSWNNYKNKVYQMITPVAKIPFELGTGQTYWPDLRAGRPIYDPWEYVANALTLKDEYNYFLTGKPQPTTYLRRKLNNTFLREYDVDMLAYYEARKIVDRYKGFETRSLSQDPKDRARSEAAWNYSLALRYNRIDEANGFMDQYLLNGGTRQGLINLITQSGKNPFRSLDRFQRLDLYSALTDPNYIPLTDFVQSLTVRELMVMRDAASYYARTVSGDQTDFSFLK